VESFTPSDPSPSSSPTRTSPNGSLESRSHLATSPSIADQMNGKLTLLPFLFTLVAHACKPVAHCSSECLLTPAKLISAISACYSAGFPAE